MRGSSTVLALVVGVFLLGATCRSQDQIQRLDLDRKGETIVLEPFAPNILRVTLSLARDPALAAPGYGFVASPEGAGWSATRTENADFYQSSRMVVTVDRPQPVSEAPVQTQSDIGNFFNGSTPGAHITFRTAGRQEAA